MTASGVKWNRCVRAIVACIAVAGIYAGGVLANDAWQDPTICGMTECRLHVPTMPQAPFICRSTGTGILTCEHYDEPDNQAVNARDHGTDGLRRSNPCYAGQC